MAESESQQISSDSPFGNQGTIAVYLAIRDAQTKILPAICGLGFVTNILSLLVFLRPRLKNLSCSVYLATKAVTDFLFLLTVFIIWLSRINIEVFNYSGVCQVILFFSYLTAFISIWLAVVITVENLLCVIKPLYVQKSCNAYSAAITTLIIIVLGIMLYHFSLWNNGVRPKPKRHNSPINVTKGTNHESYFTNATQEVSLSHGSSSELKNQYTFEQTEVIVRNVTSESLLKNVTRSQTEQICMPLEEFSHLIIAMTYIDSVLTLFVPLLVLAVNNAAIVFLAMRSRRRRSRLRQNDVVRHHISATNFTNHRQTAASLEAQASRFLFAISMTTLLFHLPSHMVRLKSMLFGFSTTDILLQRVFETLYYSHYAIGFFVYLIFGKNFRKVFIGFITARRSCQ